MMQATPLDPPSVGIVVTGSALPAPKAERVYTIDRIDRRRIEQAPSHQLDQLLKEVPGLQLFRRSDSRSGHPTSQGVTLRALGGNASSRALLILDGVPKADPFGGWVNWPAYDPQTMSGVRVVRGGGSVADGPGSLAGTIEMTTRSDVGISSEMDAGTRDAFEARGRMGIELGGGTLSLAGRGDRGDGFVPITQDTRGPADHAAPYRGWSGRGRWAGNLAASTELQASLAGFHDWRNRGTDYSSDRTDGADASLRMVGRGKWQWSALGYWQWRELRSSTAGLSPGRASASRVLLQDSVPSHGLGGRVEVRPPLGGNAELRAGADTRRTTGETRELANYVTGEPTRRRRAGGETWTSGIFAEASLDSARLIISGGARFDHWSVTGGHLFEQTIATGAITRDEHYQKRDGWLPTARGGVRVPFSGGFSLRSAAYLGWRMPTLNELFRPFRAGLDATAANSSLDPERLAGAEAGIEYRRDALSTSLTAFENRLTHAIGNVTLGHGPGTFPQVGVVAPGGQFRQRQNIDAVKVKGLEGSVQWMKGPWSVSAGLSLTRARLQASGEAAFLDGLRPAQTPKFAATFTASWQRGGKGVQIVVRHVGAQYEDDLNTRALNAATTVDAFISWPVTRSVQIIARGENVTNALVVAGIGGDGSVERATPRTMWIGLRFR
jgi:outer membrane receptor protein involved in Fe transport